MKKSTAMLGITYAIVTMLLILSFNPSLAQSGNNLIIDDFSSDHAIIFVTLNGTNPDGSSVAATDVVGGERDVSVEVTSGSNANAEVASGTFNLSVGANSSGSSSIVYDGQDGDPFAIDFDGLNSLDLTNGGTEDRFKISVVSSDHAGTITIDVYSDEGNRSSVVREFAENMSTENIMISFSEFSGSADFSNVGAIVITASGEPEIDLIIDRICTEGPVPSGPSPSMCELTSITAGAATCAGNTGYTVTVSWVGADASVSLIAGGAGSPASMTTPARDGSVTFTYPRTDLNYNITFSDTEGFCSGLGSGLSGSAPNNCAPPAACELTSITAGPSTCVGNNSYSVTVSWIGADASVSLIAGGAGSPASMTTPARDGSVTFTYPLTDLNYNITFSDTEGLCTSLGSGLSGSAPNNCAPPAACELTSITAGPSTCAGNDAYTVTVSWVGADASVSLIAGGAGSPASMTTPARDGSVTFTYPLTDLNYNISLLDTEGLCTGIGLGSGLSGNAPGCAAPPAACELTSISAGAATCSGNDAYTVTVSWVGADASVILTAGGAGSPASVSTLARDGSQTFTYPRTDLNYSLSFSDSDGLCAGLGRGISGSAPSCAPTFAGVPTMGEWGLICLTLIFLIFGTMAMRQYVFTPSIK